MDFRTKIDIKKSTLDIDHHSKMMLMGSCFAQNIGNKLTENKFKVDFGPSGILYNPLSISASIKRLISRQEYSSDELFYHNEMYQSFMHHGSFSATDRDVCLNNINNSFIKSCSMIEESDVFLFTFGTAYIFMLKETNQVVANCHKLPADRFIRQRLTVEEIVDEWSTVLNQIIEINPKSKFIFTVSPIRHWKDGAHENVVSKSILHLAIDRLQTLYPSILLYFPAYEIVIDELRDYRFYEEDMIHPSSLAVDYIWNRFGRTFFSTKTLEINRQWNNLAKAINHRPINNNTESYFRFLRNTLYKLNSFQSMHPHINCEDEIKLLTDIIKQ